jgi:predicted CoA-binding protein
LEAAIDSRQLARTRTRHGVQTPGAEEWRTRLVTAPAELARIIRECRRIAVLGMKPETLRGQPAFDVPAYMLEHGYDVVPVPVYHPEVTAILGRPVYRSVASVPGPIDMVNVFRRPQDIPPHVPDIIAARPRVVWFQLGISHGPAAEALARAGIEVVQDRCLLVEHRRWSGT